MAHKANYTAVIPHRSGETEDTIFPTLLATNAGRSRQASAIRTFAKYNQLIRIEELLGPRRSLRWPTILP